MQQRKARFDSLRRAYKRWPRSFMLGGKTTRLGWSGSKPFSVTLLSRSSTVPSRPFQSLVVGRLLSVNLRTLGFCHAGCIHPLAASSSSQKLQRAVVFGSHYFLA